MVAAAAAALSSLVAQNENAQDAARNVGALQKLLRSVCQPAPLSWLLGTIRMTLVSQDLVRLHPCTNDLGQAPDVLSRD